MAEHLIQALVAVNELDETTRKNAERTLEDLQRHPDFSLIVSNVLRALFSFLHTNVRRVHFKAETPTLAAPVRLATALLFKNFVKKHWSSVCSDCHLKTCSCADCVLLFRLK
jgi:hypothetical protein